MIDARELRIGNWVNFNDDDAKFMVTEISESGIGVKNENEETWIELDQFSPIPLTPEILEKCGFEKQMAWTYCIEVEGNKKLVYYFGEKGWSIGNKDYSDFSNLKYLHQLQNLYFALTGEELTIKL